MSPRVNFEPGSTRHGDRDRLRAGKDRVGLEIVEPLAGDGDVDDAVVARLGKECGDQSLAVVARLGEQAERAGDRALFFRLQQGGLFKRLAQVVVGVDDAERHAVAQRIDDVGILVLGRAPQPDAEDLEGRGVAHFGGEHGGRQ